MSPVVDIHPHIISADDKAYPRVPLFGVQSEWSKERPTPIEDMIAAMDAAGVAKAAIVHSSTCYGFDCSYLADSAKLHPKRVTGVGSVDMLAADAPKVMSDWVARGLTGFRIFTGGSTKEFDTSALDDPASFPAWKFCEEHGLPMCIQTGASGHAQIAGLAKRFPKVNIILDHFARVDVSDGAPYKKGASLFALSAFDNIYLKLTPFLINRANEAPSRAEDLLGKAVSVFGADHIAWGSNYPTNKGTLGELLQQARDLITFLDAKDQALILGGTALTLYPSLKD